MAFVIGGALLAGGAAYTIYRYNTVVNPGEGLDGGNAPAEETVLRMEAVERVALPVIREVGERATISEVINADELVCSCSVECPSFKCGTGRMIAFLIVSAIVAGVVFVVLSKHQSHPCEITVPLDSSQGERMYGGTNCPTPSPTSVPTLSLASNSSSLDVLQYPYLKLSSMVEGFSSFRGERHFLRGSV